MEQLPIAKVDYEEARHLADLVSTAQDLGYVVEVCDCLLAMVSDGVEDSVLSQAYWSSALVAYVRCFATGVRAPLTEADVATLEGDGLEAHRIFKSMRDKHIAHSVNPFEQILVGVMLPPTGSDEVGVQGVATLSANLVTLSEEWITLLRNLARMLREMVVQRARNAEDAVLQVAKAESFIALRKREPLRVYAPGERGDEARPR